MRGVHIVRWMVVIQVVIGLKVVRGADPPPPPPPPNCAIPDGSFDEMTVESNKKQPYYGFRCPTSNTTVQVRKMKCMPYFCCQEPCNCGGPNIQTYMACPNSTKPRSLSCYVLNIGLEGSLYGCCEGAAEDEFHVCSKAINCAVANGGCDQLCRHNDTTGKDFCACYAGYQRQLTNSDGTILCKGDGPISTLAQSVAATDTSSTTITPAPVVSVPSGFPIPYIIAIIVGVGLLLLLLLLLLLILLCIRRRKKKAAVTLDSKPVVVFVTAEDLIGEKKVKDFGVKVEDDDEKVKGEKNGRMENDYSEDPVGGRVEATSVYSDRIECDDGTYAEIPEKYGDLCESKYDEIPANIYEKSQA